MTYSYGDLPSSLVWSLPLHSSVSPKLKKTQQNKEYIEDDNSEIKVTVFRHLIFSSRPVPVQQMVKEKTEQDYFMKTKRFF